MRRFLMFFLGVFFLGLNLNAQEQGTEEENQYKSFSLVYIDHEAADAVDVISQRLRDMKDDADQYNNSYIFYLANGEQPIIVKYNMGEDATEDFNNLLGELNNAIFHSVDPNTDMKNLMDLFNQYDFVDEKGNPKYYSTIMDFYVGADFWTLGYNESILANLYFLLDVPTLKVNGDAVGKEFLFRVNASKGNYPKYEEGKPFGEKNLAGVNSVIIMQYTE